MNLNVYAVEKLMLERRAEVEANASTAWRWSNVTNTKINPIGDLIHKISFFKPKAQVQPAVCCCCS